MDAIGTECRLLESLRGIEYDPETQPVTELNIPSPVRFLPKQADVFKACQKYRAVLYSGAFRAGKTLLLANVTINMCLDNPGCIGLLGASVESQARDVVLSTLVNQLDLYQRQLNKYLHPKGLSYVLVDKIIATSGQMKVHFTNNSMVYVKSCDDHRKLSGRTLDFFCLDEAIDMDESIFTELMGRISGTGKSKHRFGLMCTNPGAETHWIYKYFYLEKPHNYATVETTTYDNVLLPEYSEYIRSLERIYDRDWILRFLDGRWGAFSGQIFKEFSFDRHTGLYVKNNMKFKKYFAGVDYGIRAPACILTAGLSDDNKMYVVNEFYKENLSSLEIINELLRLHGDYNYSKIFIDPSAADLILQGYNKGLPCGKMRDERPMSYANNDIRSSISKLKSLLKKEYMFLDRSCYHTIKEIQSYRYKKDTDMPIQKEDHGVDAWRYLVTDYSPFDERTSFGVVYWGNKRWI